MFGLFKKQEEEKIKQNELNDFNEELLYNKINEKYNEIEKFIDFSYENNKTKNNEAQYLFNELITLSKKIDEINYNKFRINNKIRGCDLYNEELKEIKEKEKNEAINNINIYKEAIEYKKRVFKLNNKQIKKLYYIINTIKKEHQERFEYHFEEHERVFNKKLEISNCEWSYYSPEFKKEITSDDYQEFLKIKKYKSVEKIPKILKEKIKVLEL